jgi:hypothetical protein
VVLHPHRAPHDGRKGIRRAGYHIFKRHCSKLRYTTKSDRTPAIDR